MERQTTIGEKARAVDWTLLDHESSSLCSRYMRIMAQMDRHYADADLAEVAGYMTSEGRAYYIGEGNGFEVALGFRWYPKRKMYCIQSTGFVGQIEPWEAVELAVAKVKSFALERRLRSVFAIVPDRMDNPRILQFYDILLWRKDLLAAGGHQVEGGKYWKLSWTAEEELLLGDGPELHPPENVPGL